MNLWIRFETMFSRVFTFKPDSKFETADSADSADLRRRADGLCHLQFRSG